MKWANVSFVAKTCILDVLDTLSAAILFLSKKKIRVALGLNLKGIMLSNIKTIAKSQ